MVSIQAASMDINHLSLLHNLLSSFSPISDASIQLVWENAAVENYHKNQIIFQEKKFNTFEYFQLKGVAHRYNLNDEQEIVTTGIYQNQSVITPHFARTKNSQSIFSLQALVDCVYVKVPAGVFLELREKHPQLRAFGMAVVEREFIRSLHFEVMFRTYSAKDRLLHFREQYPSLENQVPHTVIASFLGITPVSFSRLRNDLAKID